MTLAEQDKKLRESTRKSIALLVAQRRGAVKWDEQDYIAAGNILFVCTKLITADRKRVALEARIDEINYLDDNFQVDSQDWEREHLGYSTAMIPMEDYIRRRTELKAQQEQL